MLPSDQDRNPKEGFVVARIRSGCPSKDGSAVAGGGKGWAFFYQIRLLLELFCLSCFFVVKRPTDKTEFA